MKKYVYLAFIFSLLLVVTMSNRLGRATVAGLGSTGAPGDDATVCQSCHNGPITTATQILVLDNADTVTQYEPNKTYQIHVRVNYVSGNKPKAHGFQMTLLNAAKGKTGTNLKTISPISSNVKLVTTPKGRLYAEQTDRSATNLFEIQWVAPAAGSGPVTIYAGGNGVNSDGSESGDGGSKSSFQIEERIPASTQAAATPSLVIYPNPFTERFWIQGDTNGLNKVEVVDLFGKKIKEIDWMELNHSIDLSNLNDGIYFAKLFDQQNNIIKTQKLLKRAQRT